MQDYSSAWSQLYIVMHHTNSRCCSLKPIIFSVFLPSFFAKKVHQRIKWLQACRANIRGCEVLWKTCVKPPEGHCTGSSPSFHLSVDHQTISTSLIQGCVLSAARLSLDMSASQENHMWNSYSSSRTPLSLVWSRNMTCPHTDRKWIPAIWSGPHI